MSLDFGKLDFAVAFNRQTAFPLDAKSYFESLASAQAAAASAEAAGSKNTTYYYGETLAVVESGSATLYVIQPDNSLKEVGGNIAINENIFAKIDDKLDLVGFAGAVAGAQLVKGSDGKLSWVKPDTTTVEGLSTTVAQLQNTIDGYTDDSGVAHTGLVSRVSTLENELDNVYTKTEVDTKISSVMRYKGSKDTYAELPSTAEVGDVWNVVQADSEHGVRAGDNLAWNGTAWDNLGGSVDLSGYATKSDLDTKVDKVDGSRLMTNAEGTKLAGIEDGAQVNFISSVDTDELSVSSGKLSITKVSSSKITGLQKQLDNKVDIESGKGLSTNDYTTAEKTKLSKIEDGAQANILETIKANGSALPITDKSVNIPIATAEALGLVKSSSAENFVAVLTDGTLEVNALNVNKLSQTTGDTLILNGGGSTT